MLKKQFYEFSKKQFWLRYLQHHIFDCWTALDQGYPVSFQLESHHNLACKRLLSHQLNHQAMFPQLAAKKLLHLSVSRVVLKGLWLHFQLFFKGVQLLIFNLNGVVRTGYNLYHIKSVLLNEVQFQTSRVARSS